MSITIIVIFLCLTSITYAVCRCVPLSNTCVDKYSNTWNSSCPCDIIEITTDDYNLTQECIDSNINVPYIEIYAKSFTLQANFFETSGGIYFKTKYCIYWSGFNNFEQMNEVTYIDILHIVTKDPFVMTTGTFYLPSPVNFNVNSIFALSGDAIFEVGGNVNGEQTIYLDSFEMTLKDDSLLNLSTSIFRFTNKLYVYNNSRIIYYGVASGCIGYLYFYDSSTLILEEGYHEIYMRQNNLLYNNSILQIKRETNSLLNRINLYDTSLLNISESSFVQVDYFYLSSTASIKIWEDSVLQTPLDPSNSLITFKGEIIFNNKARLNSITSTTSLPSTFSLKVIETIIGYPIISLWNVTSMLSSIKKVGYNGNECIDVYSFASSNDDLTLPSNYYQLANNQLIRYCPSSVDYDVHCYLNTSIWNSSFIDSNGYPIFISPHCMNSNYSNYLCHSIQNTFEVGSDSINITFAELMDVIIISEPTSNQQILNGCFNTIETPIGLKINTNTNQNTRSSTLKGETMEPNTFLTIETSTITINTINTINDEIQLDLTSLTLSPSYTFSLNTSVIKIIDNSNTTLNYTSFYFQFINSNNYEINVEFIQDEFLLYSENGFYMEYGGICYCLLFYYFYSKILISRYLISKR
ncbi:hypothetical protein QTN25_003544 [Entamoeba marina]